jgi:hypothetical protein
MSVNYMDKDICWRSLLNLKNSEFSTYCIIVGDFNAIIHNSEKRGGRFVRDPFREKLEELIVDWDLLDIKPIKGSILGPTKDQAPVILQLDLTYLWFMAIF